MCKLLHVQWTSPSEKNIAIKTNYSNNEGNPKTLTPGPRTPTMDQVSGLRTDRSTDYPYRPLYGPPPKLNLKGKKNRNKDFTYFLSMATDHSCRNFERYTRKM